MAIGDSVMLGAKGALEARMPGIYVDAAVNRQVKAGADLAATLKAQGAIGRAAVVHLGTNGVTTQHAVRPADEQRSPACPGRPGEHEGPPPVGETA